NICLLCLIKAAVLGVDLDQSPKVLVKEKGKTIFLPCKDNRQSSDYIHWYQVKDGQAPSRLLYISQGGSVAYDTNVKEAKDFTVDKKKLYDLKLSNTQTSHSAVYFCAYWDSSNHSEKIYSHPVHKLYW
uniref:T cell receptor gamma variable 1 n=1 Tax=Cyprinus carpio TaxID=7962 RepID=A0A8C2GNY4_CYPCA